jgi:hypothetical protein
MSIVEVNRTAYWNMAVPVGTVTGDPVSAGFITGHALNNRDAVLGTADVALPRVVEIVDIPVTAIFAITPVTIAVGDELYEDGAGTVSNDATGVHYGYAAEVLAIVGGVDTTATINVIKGWL